MQNENKPRVLLSHSGKQHAYHVALSLFNLGYLYQFHTSSYVRKRIAQKILMALGDKFLTKRFLKGLHGDKIKSNWRFEIPEMILSKLCKDRTVIQNAVYNRDIKFDRHIVSVLNRPKANFYWGFQGSCYNSIIAAKKKGIHTICELSTGHVVESINLLSEERILQPKWADSFDNLDFPEQYLKRLQMEPHEADTVIAASSFTKDTLIKDGVSENKIKLLPLGFDIRYMDFEENIQFDMNRPLKLLYAGRVTQRKGVSYLLEAMKKLKNIASLDIIGFVHGKGRGLEGYEDFFTLMPPINQHELFQKYADYDALVLPSIFEGFGLVVIEAMAAGLPVITTENTIGKDIIENNINGFLVEIRSAEEIENAVYQLKNKNEEERKALRENARKTALDLSWDNYSINLKNLFCEL